MYGNEENVDVLMGKTLIEALKTNGEYGDEIVFKTIEGETFKMLHFQDCCETVEIEEIFGDLKDLIGTPITMAEQATGEGENPVDCSQTWTFYKFATIKGYVTIRWLGDSNGYYSETVDFVRMENQ